MSKKKKDDRGYSQETLENAVKLVDNGTLSYRKASIAFKVPTTVIFNRINGK